MTFFKRLVSFVLTCCALVLTVLGAKHYMGSGCPDARDRGRIEEVWPSSDSSTGWFATLSVFRHSRNNAPEGYHTCYPNRGGGWIYITDVEITADEAQNIGRDRDRPNQSVAFDPAPQNWLPEGWEGAVLGGPYAQTPPTFFTLVFSRPVLWGGMSIVLLLLAALLWFSTGLSAGAFATMQQKGSSA